MLAAVPLPTPDIDSMIEGLERLTERVKAGDFETLFIIAIDGERCMHSFERGRRLSRIELIGMLECWKVDLFDTMDVKSGPPL